MEQAVAMAEVLVGAGEQVARALRACARAPTSRRTSSRSTGSRTRATGISRDAVASLFANGIDPMVVIRWKDIFESLEAAWTRASGRPRARGHQPQAPPALSVAQYVAGVTGFPLPGTAAAVVAAGARSRRGLLGRRLSAALDDDGGVVLAYRCGRPGDAAARARSWRARPTASASKPSCRLDRTGSTPSRSSGRRWCGCRTGAGGCTSRARPPAAKHWWIEALEAGRPRRARRRRARVAFCRATRRRRQGPGDPAHATAGGTRGSAATPSTARARRTACTRAYADSADGVRWAWQGIALRGRPGTWDARGARVTAVLRRRPDRLRRARDQGGELLASGRALAGDARNP